TRTTVQMTTDVIFTINTKDESAANQAIDNAIAEIQRIEALLSEWQPSSEISQINRNGFNQPVTVSAETLRLLEESLAISQASEGAFDITFKSAGRLWDFRNKTIPSAEALAAATAAIDYHRVEITPALRQVRLLNPDTQIGLGGIAKGYAVDRAAQILRKAGFSEFTINAGGDLYAAGSNKVWRVGIQHPRKQNALIATLPVANAAVATSGDYERFFKKDGIRYHHIIDPKTGLPARGSMSVTVIAPRAYMADALATAVFVLGPDAGLKMIEGIDGCAAMVVTNMGDIRVSSGLPELSALD
ncbi:MAG: FAD:protein FMN transferase, partial [Thalassolituus sp.]